MYSPDVCCYIDITNYFTKAFKNYLLQKSHLCLFVGAFVDGIHPHSVSSVLRHVLKRLDRRLFLEITTAKEQSACSENA